jgi:hypothetical protein
MKTPGAHLFSAAKAMPREQGSMATCGVECGDIGSGWKAMVGATRPMCAWRVASLNRARMAVRRGGGGGPTAHGPAGIGRPRRAGPVGPWLRTRSVPVVDG